MYTRKLKKGSDWDCWIKDLKAREQFMMAVKRMKRVYRVLRGKSDIFMVKTLVVYQLLDKTVEVL